MKKHYVIYFGLIGIGAFAFQFLLLSTDLYHKHRVPETLFLKNHDYSEHYKFTKEFVGDENIPLPHLDQRIKSENYE